jgi:hypothetical protein
MIPGINSICLSSKANNGPIKENTLELYFIYTLTTIDTLLVWILVSGSPVMQRSKFNL